MPFEVMVVVLVAIGCTYELLKRIVCPGPLRNEKEFLTELRALREDVRQLRQESHDVILTFDTSLQRVDDRVGSLEARAQELGPGEPEVSESRLVASPRS